MPLTRSSNTVTDITHPGASVSSRLIRKAAAHTTVNLAKTDPRRNLFSRPKKIVSAENMSAQNVTVTSVAAYIRSYSGMALGAIVNGLARHGLKSFQNSPVVILV